MKKIKGIKGITLIALVITIIVMLILVGVALNVVLNGNLVGNASTAKDKQAIERDKELLYVAALGCMKDGKVIFDKENNGLDNNLPDGFDGENGEYVKDKRAYTVDENGNVEYNGEYISEYVNVNDLTLGEGVSLVEEKNLTGDIKKAVDMGKISAVLKETINGEEILAIVPAGFKVSSTAGENKISEGLVIYDGESNDNKNNEFVWIPVPEKNMKVATFENQYEMKPSGANLYTAEPKELTDKDDASNYIYDSQEELNFWYGTKEDGVTPYFNYESDFAYESHYIEMAESINKYGGFYIGRYETTIDEDGNIGSKYNTKILVARKTLKEDKNSNYYDQPYLYRWWGLYNAQRFANIVGNGNIIQTNMIWGQEWDKMIEFMDSIDIDYSRMYNGPSHVQSSGKSTYNKESGGTLRINDILYNIYDLRGNACDTTATGSWSYYRVIRGGMYRNPFSANENRVATFPNTNDSDCGSRMTFYIK